MGGRFAPPILRTSSSQGLHRTPLRGEEAPHRRLLWCGTSGEVRLGHLVVPTRAQGAGRCAPRSAGAFVLSIFCGSFVSVIGRPTRMNFAAALASFIDGASH